MIRGPLLHASPRQRLNGTNDVCLRIATDAKCKLAARTRKHYADLCRQLQQRHPEVRINEFEPHHLDHFFTFANDGTRRIPGDRGWREATINNAITAFVYVFGWADKHSLLDNGPNPTLHLREEWGQKPVNHRQGVWLDHDEIEALCDLDVGDDLAALRDRILFRVLVGTGVREMEAEALRWGQLSNIGSPRCRIRVHGKGNKFRDVTPLAATRAALVQWRDTVTRLRGAPPAPTDPVIPSARNVLAGRGRCRREFEWTVALGTAGIADVVEQGGARIGRPALRPHDLRRTHAGYLEDNGISLRAIKDQLGHGNLAITERYLSNNPGRLEAELLAAGI